LQSGNDAAANNANTNANFTLMYNLLYSLLQTSGNSATASSSVGNFGAMLAQFNPAFTGLNSGNLSHLTANLTNLVQQQQHMQNGDDDDDDNELNNEDTDELDPEEDEEEAGSNATSSINKYFVHNDTNTSTENSESPFNEDLAEPITGGTASSASSTGQNEMNCGYASNEMEVCIMYMLFHN
jgi:hypothetical protein